MRDFALTEQHIKLLQRMYVTWFDCEFGSPAIDPKRPYGNSDCEEDIAEILGIEWEDDGDGMSDDLRERMEDLHKETEVALQIVLCTASFHPGTYRKMSEYDDRSWELVA
jgi:hypothetical protein